MDNEDRNSYDRAIVTLRSEVFGNGLPGFSFFVGGALQNGPVYVRDLGVLVRRAGQGPDFASFEKNWGANHPPTLYEQIHTLPEQTWEQSWANMPRKKSRMYFTIGCEGSRQKFGVEPTGDEKTRPVSGGTAKKMAENCASGWVFHRWSRVTGRSWRTASRSSGPSGWMARWATK
jgi:hypothetical protein